jgi:Fe-S-cluster containining protein
MACRKCALCCQCIRFSLPPDDDREHWMRLFGLIVSRMPSGQTSIIVPKRCDNLDPKTLRCRDYENRPTICREFLCDEARKEAPESREQAPAQTDGMSVNEAGE